ncbi:sigma-70 family RNA polymerase sigma factor [Lysinibacillus sp. 1P01SD]|uniref:sigma-70 family RNA polymerase sigma factor n=1 Tax=Lysinibacillus sp. 1P01SD TaxID=3132285 RepID=UPI0039A1BEAB
MGKLNLLMKKVNDYLIEFNLTDEIYVDEVQAYLSEISDKEVSATQVVELLKLRNFKNIVNSRPKQNNMIGKKIVEDDDEIDFLSLLENNQEDVSFVEALQNNYSKNKYLISQYQTHDDEKSLIELVELNIGLVRKEVFKWNSIVNHKLSDEDLIQEGILGLIEGIDRFDIEKGNMMSTYVIHYIRKNIIRAIFNTGHIVRLPVHVFEAILKIRKVERESEVLQENEEYVLRTLEMSREKYLSLKKIEADYLKMTSLNLLVSEEGGDTELFELLDPTRAEIVGGIQNDEILSPLESYIKDEEKKQIQNLLLSLTDKEADILLYRFGFKDNRVYTLEEVGKLYGVTRERIRQIEAKALKKLSRKIRGNEIFI